MLDGQQLDSNTMRGAFDSCNRGQNSLYHHHEVSHQIKNNNNQPEFFKSQKQNTTQQPEVNSSDDEHEHKQADNVNVVNQQQQQRTLTKTSSVPIIIDPKNLKGPSPALKAYKFTSISQLRPEDVNSPKTPDEEGSVIAKNPYKDYELITKPTHVPEFTAYQKWHKFYRTRTASSSFDTAERWVYDILVAFVLALCIFAFLQRVPAALGF